ncbi:MAG: hypothetical protein SGJ23_16620, partial [Alphaproteobacteria bacterium]|nr:hypothetical protein [Alphaproteobacteria bacterium]
MSALTLLGWALMAVAVLMWLALIAVPFAPQLEGRRMGTAVLLWLGGETLFALGALAAAPALLKSHWLRKLLG